jgi:hypothetical protein
VKLLQAAREIMGSEKALADELGIGEKLLSIFLDDRRALPDALLLRAVDIILADRHSRLGSPPRSSLALEGLPNER